MPEPVSPTRVVDDIDIYTTAGKPADFERRAQEATRTGSKRAIERQHARREDDGPRADRCAARRDLFTEFDEFARHRSADFGMDAKRPSATLS